jgi:hypothetical protein
MLAGLDALCSASSFPAITVGDPNVESKEYLKACYDTQAIVENDLNPKFYKMYELDSILPLDWKLEIKIMNKGPLSDSLIGAFAIDLEDRILGILLSSAD